MVLLDRVAVLEDRVLGERVVVDLRVVPVDFFATVVRFATVARAAPDFLGDFLAVTALVTAALAVLFLAVPFLAVRVILVVDVFFAI